MSGQPDSGSTKIYVVGGIEQLPAELQISVLGKVEVLHQAQVQNVTCRPIQNPFSRISKRVEWGASNARGLNQRLALGFEAWDFPSGWGEYCIHCRAWRPEPEK